MLLNFSSDIHSFVPLHSAFRRAMLNQEHYQMTRAKFSGGGAVAHGAKFGVRGLALAFIGRGSARPTLRAVRARPGEPGRNKAAASRRTPHKAKKKPWPPWRLIATHAKLEFALTHWNHNLLTISNRNKKHVSAAAPTSSSTDHGPRINEFLIGTLVQTEIVSSHRKQRKASNSNRGYSRPARRSTNAGGPVYTERSECARRSIWGCGGGGGPTRSCPPRITNHGSQITVPMRP